MVEGKTGQIGSCEAVKHGGLRETKTVKKQRAFLSRDLVKENQEVATAKRPVKSGKSWRRRTDSNTRRLKVPTNVWAPEMSTDV